MSKQGAPSTVPARAGDTVHQPLTATEATALARVFKAVADPVRLRLVSLIGARPGGEACAGELAEAFSLAGPTISHHLKVLREAGVLDSQRRGTWIYYRLRPQVLRQLAATLTPPAGHPPGPV